jgi:hypothetical protein
MEVLLRGYRISKASRKLDVVLVAARYVRHSNELECSQAYVRRGPIWGDIVLLGRDEIIQRLEKKQRVVTGKPDAIPGEFIVFHPVELDRRNGTQRLLVGQAGAKGDDLGLPLF